MSGISDFDFVKLMHQPGSMAVVHQNASFGKLNLSWLFFFTDREFSSSLSIKTIEDTQVSENKIIFIYSEGKYLLKWQILFVISCLQNFDWCIELQIEIMHTA